MVSPNHAGWHLHPECKKELRDVHANHRCGYETNMEFYRCKSIPYLWLCVRGAVGIKKMIRYPWQQQRKKKKASLIDRVASSSVWIITHYSSEHQQQQPINNFQQQVMLPIAEFPAHLPFPSLVPPINTTWSWPKSPNRRCPSTKSLWSALAVSASRLWRCSICTATL